MNLYELKQFVAFADLGTLSQVAEAFHISTPSVTRSMQHLEDCFSVSLFTRSKNKIELNETGKVAVEYARKLLHEAEQTIRDVQDFDARRKTLVLRSCAPAPLWELLRQLNTQYPHMTMSSAICQNHAVISAWENSACDMAILPFPYPKAVPFMQEKLFVCVPADHELAKHPDLTFRDINGFNFLLRSELGFWDTLCRKKMPASKFLVQTDESTFDELVNASSLPCFTTDYWLQRNPSYFDRVHIPLTDPEAKVTFYLLKNQKI